MIRLITINAYQVGLVLERGKLVQILKEGKYWIWGTKEVKIFDIRGRLVAEKNNINATDVNFSQLNTAQQVLLVQITTEAGELITKKVIY